MKCKQWWRFSTSSCNCWEVSRHHSTRSKILIIGLPIDLGIAAGGILRLLLVTRTYAACKGGATFLTTHLATNGSNSNGPIYYVSEYVGPWQVCSLLEPQSPAGIDVFPSSSGYCHWIHRHLCLGHCHSDGFVGYESQDRSCSSDHWFNLGCFHSLGVSSMSTEKNWVLLTIFLAVVPIPVVHWIQLVLSVPRSSLTNGRITLSTGLVPWLALLLLVFSIGKSRPLVLLKPFFVFFSFSTVWAHHDRRMFVKRTVVKA